jgi:hypothetical protein
VYDGLVIDANTNPNPNAGPSCSYSSELDAYLTSCVQARIDANGGWQNLGNGTCVACADSVCADHDLYCSTHHAAMRANMDARYAERVAELAAKRRQSAQDGAETRRRADGSQVINGERVTRSSAQVAAGQRKYQQIRSRCARGY